MPTSRSELAAAALAGRIYVAGGIAQLGTTAAFEAYDPATDHWEELPPLPEAVHHLAAAATDKRVYVTGGYTNLLYARVYGVDRAVLAYPGTSAARCLHRDFVVNDGGAIRISVCQLPLFEDGAGELDRVLGHLIAHE